MQLKNKSNNIIIKNKSNNIITFVYFNGKNYEVKNDCVEVNSEKEIEFFKSLGFSVNEVEVVEEKKTTKKKVAKDDASDVK